MKEAFWRGLLFSALVVITALAMTRATALCRNAVASAASTLTRCDARQEKWDAAIERENACLNKMLTLEYLPLKKPAAQPPKADRKSAAAR